MQKKFLALLLSIVMIIGIIPIEVFAKSENGSIYEDTYEEFIDTYDEELKNDDKLHSFIVEVQTGTAGRSVFRSAKTNDSTDNETMIAQFQEAKSSGRVNSYLQSREEEQDAIISKIFKTSLNDTGLSGSRFFRSFSQASNDTTVTGRYVDTKKMVRLKTVLNGFGAELSYEEAKEVAKLPGVEGVYLAREYNRPGNVTPLMKESRDLVFASEANGRSYNGAGRLVAILDTGADVNHKDLVLTEEGKSQAKYTRESIEEKIQEFQLFGAYRTTKVPYAYNYADREQEILDDANHGQHIAGTIAGNGKVKGIVPEAQLLVMRVFGLDKPTTSSISYAEAIDDSVLLGADSINMSLGSYAGSQSNRDEIMVKIIENAKRQGSTVVIAGGNDGYQMSGIKDQPIDLVDFSTIGSPSTMKESLAVASFNNLRVLQTHAIIEKGSESKIETYPGSAVENSKDNEFKYNEYYEFVEVGLGNTEEDYAGKELDGKIALAQRGTESFTHKAQMADKHGALAIIIGDNQQSSGRFTMSMENNLIKAFFVHLDQYQELKAKNSRIKISNEEYYVDSANAGTMSNFNSWGPTPGLKIKPEIAAPGGDIYSTDNNGGYTYMSGTSMATPHVAGGIAAVNKFVEDNITKDKAKISDYTRNILMATAVPQKLKGNPDKYFMVRSQGAGLMNLDYATRENQVLVRDNDPKNSSRGDAKIELGELDKNSFDISLELENLSNSTVNYDVYYVLQTDKIVDGKYQLDMDNYDLETITKKTKLGDISVGSKSKAVFSKNISYVDTFLKRQSNYYVDGFIFFEPKADDGEFSPLSIPLLGFRGDWYKQPIIENYIDTFNIKNGELPFFVNRLKVQNPGLNNYPYGFSYLDIPATYFLAQMNDLISGRYDVNILGRNTDGSFTDKYAISPNGDTEQDYMTLSAVFLRNYDNFRIKVYDQNEKLIKEIFNIYRQSGRKGAHTVDMQNPVTADRQDMWTWDGTDKDGNTVADGSYKLTLSVGLADTDKTQELSRNIIVDTQKPSITSIIDAENYVEVKAEDLGSPASGIKAIYYIQAENLNELTKDIEGSYKLDKSKVEKFDLNQGKFLALDWAGNRVERSLGDQLGDVSLVINRQIEDDNGQRSEGGPNTTVNVYRLEEDGNLGEEVKDITKLAIGRYKLVFQDEPANYKYEWIAGDEFEVDETTEKVEKTIVFRPISTKDFGTLSVELVWPGDFDGQIKLYARRIEEGPASQGTSENNEKGILLSREFGFSGIRFSEKLAPGKYEVYGLDQEGNLVSLLGNKIVNVRSQETSGLVLQVSNDLAYLKLYLVANRNLYEYFQENGSIISGNKDGTTFEFIKDLENYVTIENTVTGQSLFETDYIKGYSGKDPYNTIITYDGEEDGLELDIQILAPIGKYRLQWKNLDGLYASEGVIENFTSDFSDHNGTWKGFMLEDKSRVNGSLTLTESMLPGVEGEPDGRYMLYNSLGQEVKSYEPNKWTNLPVGNYRLEVENLSTSVRPEREFYEFEVINGSSDHVIDIRWASIARQDRYGELVIGLYSDDRAPINLEKVQVKLINLTDSDADPLKFEFEPNNVFKTTIPNAKYQVVFESLGQYQIKDVFLSTDDYSNSGNEVRKNNNSFEMPIFRYYNEIEIRLTKTEIIPGEIQIEETGVDNDFSGARYELSDPIYGVRYGNQLQASFNSVMPGEYDLNITPPTGYKVLGDNPVKILVKSNEVSKIKVEFGITGEEPDVKPDPKPEVKPEPEIDKNPDYNFIPDFIWAYPSPDHGSRPHYDYNPVEPPVESPSSVNNKNELEPDIIIKRTTKNLAVNLSDIAGHKYEMEIRDVLERGLMKGVGEGKFDPDSGITRAMVVQVLMNMTENPNFTKAEKFTDVKSEDWFFDAVTWAEQIGLVQGVGEGKFEPNRNISLQEVSIIIDNYLRRAEIKLDTVNNEKIKDTSKIADWAKDSLEEINRIGLFELEDQVDGNLILSRAELARALSVIAKGVDKK